MTSKPTPEEREVWSIGDLRLDVGQQRLWRGTDEITLPKLSFDLLLALTRRAPDVVTYDELMDRVWPGLVVSPETIVQRVRLLRTAIGDDASEPRYVEALRSRGYRLATDAARIPAATSTAPVQAASAASSSITAAPRSTPPPPALPVAPPRSPAAPPASTLPPATPRQVVPPDPAADAAPTRATGASSSQQRPVLRPPAWAALAIIALCGLLAWFAMPGARRTATLAKPPAANAPPAEVRAFEVAERARRTVAVLPFENLSPDPADAFIALAIPESTLDRLAALRGLTVIARDSAFHAGRAGLGARETGARLGAAWLVEGSTQRLGDRLRVTARLVDAQADAQVWSERYDRALTELPLLQDEIASRVVDALATRFAGLQRNVRGRDYSRNVDANLAFLRGRTLLDRVTVAGAEAAAAQFEEAIARDPDFAAAYAAQYDARLQAASLRRAGLAAARRQHQPLIERALQLDARCGTAYLARARWSDASPEVRDADFRRGLELEPSNARGIDGYVEFLDRQGRAQESARWLDRELLLDPLSAPAHFRRAIQSLGPSGSGVERAMLGVLERDPTFYPALQRYAKYRWQLNGDIAQAVEIIERAIASDPENPWGRHVAVAFYLDLGDLPAARDVAAATPVSAASSRPLVALYEGRDADAGREALDPGNQAFNSFESWGVIEALRDAALRAGPGSPYERALVARFADGQGNERGADTPLRIDLRNYRALLLVSQLGLAHARTAVPREAARTRLRELIAWMDANERYGMQHQPRALALRLLGENDRALAELAAGFAQDRDYHQWWYLLEREPAWVELHADSRFRAIADRVREHVRGEHAALETLRRDGKVPPRGSGATSVPAVAPALVTARP